MFATTMDKSRGPKHTSDNRPKDRQSSQPSKRRPRQLFLKHDLMSSTAQHRSGIDHPHFLFIVDWRVDYIVAGEVNDALESPWFLASKGLYELPQRQVTNAQLQARHHPLEPWTNVSLPYSPVITQNPLGFNFVSRVTRH